MHQGKSEYLHPWSEKKKKKKSIPLHLIPPKEWKFVYGFYNGL